MSTVGGPGKQQKITAAIENAQNTADADGAQDSPQDSRVVEAANTCHCGRAAGADGLCYPCRRDSMGNIIGNHGGRL